MAAMKIHSVAKTAIILISCSAGSAPAQTALPPATFAKVSYGTHERNTLDFWRAKSAKPAPLLIFIHGGGWAGGGKEDLPPMLLDAMLEAGVSVASINYRYSTQAILPAPVHDAARAVQFLREKAAEWHLDPARFAAYGISAGATTSLWLAYHDDLGPPSTRLRAVVALSPQPSLEPRILRQWAGDEVLKHPLMARAVGVKTGGDVLKPKPEWVKLWREFSAITHVSKDDPPVMVQHPRFDPLPAPNPGSAIHHAIFGVKLKERCDAAGATCILRLQDRPGDTPEPEAFLIEQLKMP
ncbi:MAG TPA: lipase [Verrucomicrobiales bacterium]|nr:lipase [Verrucomicrobiales bacterium]